MTREGSGNFLTETYLSLRRLENEAIRIQYGSQVFWSDYIKVSIDQFYGIEINDFAVSVARTALWIAEAQMMKETEAILGTDLEFFPLTSAAHIVEGNALQINWEDVVPKQELNYIMGNPPFVGARLMDDQQKEDMKHIFGLLRGVGNLDFVSSWFKKASELIMQTEIKCAFVATNSITQGEQVAILWEHLVKTHGIKINFAYQTFKWSSEATDQAAVHCVIVGFSHSQVPVKYLYSSSAKVKKVDHINAYLLDIPDTFIKSRSNPITNVPEMLFGSMPNDGGHLLLTSEEKDTLVRRYPQAAQYLRRFVGAQEFLNNTERWCLWIEPHDLKDVLSIRPIADRIAKVKQKRENSIRASTRELALRPYAFGEIRQPNSSYLLVPRTSSESRKYIPMGFMDPTVISSDASLIVPGASVALFAIMSSNVHMVWVNTVAGRLEMRYRYSASIVYNNFPFIQLSKEQEAILSSTGQMILKARKIYDDWSLAQMYNSIATPPELLKAHQENDKAVMEAYGFDWRTMTATECVMKLMKMYQKLVEEEN